MDVATQFTNLPFDHLVLLVQRTVGRIVMRAAAENLTPVTLELGGKSPAIIHEDFPVREAAKRIAFGKKYELRQVCVSPDYILCPRDKVGEFCADFIAQITSGYPAIASNPDVTSIITDQQKARLVNYVEDAKSKGARVIEINPLTRIFLTARSYP